MGNTSSREREALRAEKSQRWTQHVQSFSRRARTARPLVVEGRLSKMVGLTLEATGCQAAVGDRCRILRAAGSDVEAEVVGFSAGRLLLMPIGDVRGLAPDARVIPSGRAAQVAVGDALLGRVLDGLGRQLDGRSLAALDEWVARDGAPVNPLGRAPIRAPMHVGVRALDTLLAVGQGQRLGLFAPSGAGKSMLLGMMTRYASADVIVVALIGERGREVNEFISTILGQEGMRRAVVIACPADDPPLMRLHGAQLATSVAEYFRDRGRHVLLLMDSLTRFAHAQREIALAIGEPPATRGYPPSVFARLPQLVERVGNANPGGGSITAFYTVLTEADEQTDPVAEAARAILDGHIVLSRELGEQGHYPAIDIEASVSRAMPAIVTRAHLHLVQRFREIHATYRQSADMIAVGAYSAGSDPRIDEAIAFRTPMNGFLRQDMHEGVSFADAYRELEQLMRTGARASSSLSPVR